MLFETGIRRIDKIKRKKQKHTHARQLMDELVTRASNWEYDEDGKKPYKDTGKNGPMPDFIWTQSAEEDFQPPSDLQPTTDVSKEREKAINEPVAGNNTLTLLFFIFIIYVLS